jgi:hypothetical protein
MLKQSHATFLSRAALGDWELERLSSRQEQIFFALEREEAVKSGSGGRAAL